MKSLIFLFLLTVMNVTGQRYSIDHSVIASGSGSAGSRFSVHGTIGETAAGAPLKGYKYSLAGGFWSLNVAVQTTNAPVLSIAQSGNELLLSWEKVSSGFALEVNSDIVGQNAWKPVGADPTATGGVVSVRLPILPGSAFFRLRKQP